jgi:hypothetical protein
MDTALVAVQAVTTVMSNGVFYFTSAVNSGNIARNIIRDTYTSTWNPRTLANGNVDHVFPNDAIFQTWVPTRNPRGGQRIQFQYSLPSNTPTPIAFRLGLYFTDVNGNTIFFLAPAANDNRPSDWGDFNVVVGQTYNVFVQVSPRRHSCRDGTPLLLPLGSP